MSRDMPSLAALHEIDVLRDARRRYARAARMTAHEALLKAAAAQSDDPATIDRCVARFRRHAEIHFDRSASTWPCALGLFELSGGRTRKGFLAVFDRCLADFK